MADSRISVRRKVSTRAGDSTRVSMTKKHKKKKVPKAKPTAQAAAPATAPIATPTDGTKVP